MSPMQMVAGMVGEIILAVKERNKAARATAFELLVQIAHAMHEAEPPPPGLLTGFDAPMEGARAAGRGVRELGAADVAASVALVR